MATNKNVLQLSLYFYSLASKFFTMPKINHLYILPLHLVGFILLFFFACKSGTEKNSELSKVAPSDALFKKVTPEISGIDFQNKVEEDMVRNIINNPYIYNGGGVGIVDVNRDNKPDIYFTATSGPCKLYLNEGGFKFRDITDAAGVAAPIGTKTGVAIADVNGDGWDDIYVSRADIIADDNRRNLLFINNKNNTFSEQAKEYGLDDPSASNHANFLDYDQDGDLDVYVMNFPVNFKLATNMDLLQGEDGSIYRRQEPLDSLESDRLYRNNGKGKFYSVGRKAGIYNRGFGLSCTATDFNSDGYPDLLVGNDYLEPDFFYINDRKGGFKDKAFTSFRHFSNNTMGVDVGDINQDGHTDIIALDMLPDTYPRQKILATTMLLERYNLLEANGYGKQIMRNVLHVNSGLNADGVPVFSDVACLAGIFETNWSWSPLFQDYDLDGLTDLIITSGYRRDVTDLDYIQFTSDSLNRIYGPAGTKKLSSIYEYYKSVPEFKLPNYAYRNRGDLTFEKVSEAWGLVETGYANGSAWADLDGDGDLDLVMNTIDEPARVYRNTAVEEKKGAWLQLDLEGPTGNIRAFGAVARITAGGKVWQQELTPYRGFFSSSQPIFQFGLGNIQTLEKLEVQFPGEKIVVMENVPVNQRIQIKISDAKPGKLSPLPSPNALFTENSNILDFKHRDDGFVDLNRERLMPWRMSTVGPVQAWGDVNGDSREDVFIGGSMVTPSALYIQESNGTFRKQKGPWDTEVRREPGGAVFLDADSDGDLDLVCSGGGNADPAGSPTYLPKLYRNDGKGNFVHAPETLPTVYDSGGPIAVYDYDSDGDQDIFIGGWCVPGSFPLNPGSHIFQNNAGIFKEVTAQVSPAFANRGMVRAMEFCDLDGDKRAELIVAMEWMPLSIFKFQNGRFEDATTSFGLAENSGIWRSLAASDLDGDGDLDLVAGNLGLNTRYKASSAAPMFVYAKDFDGNGSIDPIVGYTENGKEYPYATRDMLIKQIPALKKKFIRAHSYAYATVEDVYPKDQLSSAQYRKVNQLETVWFENANGKLIPHALPLLAQAFPVWAVISADLNNDQRPDLIIAGNDDGQQPETGPVDAGLGLVLLNKGGGQFEPLAPRQSGLFLRGEVHSLRLIKDSKGGYRLFAGIHNGPFQSYTLKTAIQ